MLVETALDLRLLAMGALAYGGTLGVRWLGLTLLYIPASIVVLPISILTGFGILVTVQGMTSKGKNNSSRVALLMVAALGLGILGGIVLLDTAIDYEHTVSVCTDSKVVPDPNAQWACPQVTASYWLQWPLAAGLLIPALLFFVVPIFYYEEEDGATVRPERVGELSGVTTKI